MLSDIVTAISILSEIYNIYEQLKEDQILFRRLCERVQLFTKFLQELQTNCANPNYKPTASLKGYITQLTTLLNEIKDFLTKHSKKSNSFYGSFKRIIITSTFRNKFTNDLNSLNQRINDCVSNLLPSLGINFEEQRRLDTEALKNQIDYVAGDVVNQLVQLNSQGNSSEMMELLTDIKSNSDNMESEIMGQILELEKKISSNKALTSRDFVDLEELFHREKETLKAFLDEKLAEYNNQIQLGLHKVEEKIDEVLYKILNEINLSKNEKQKRQELLGQVIIPPSARVEVTETVLGMGGFGTVFLGVYGASKVAIKALNSANGREMEAVENEVLLMNYLGSQPNILTCYGIWKDTRGHTFIVLDYSPFGSLVEILNDFRNFPEISIRLQIGWVIDLINAVSFIHRRKVKHRDIKADNLLVFSGLTVKLCDFGLSKKHSQSAVSSVFGGTQGFMAPEVVTGKGSGFPSDVFSWAMTFYQIVMRECPQVALSHSQKMENVLIELEDKLDGVELGPLASLLMNCIEDNPEERPLACDINEFMLRFLGDIGGNPRLGIRAGDEEMVSDFEGQLKKTKKINVLAKDIDGHKTAEELKKADEEAAAKAARLKKAQEEAELKKAQEVAKMKELRQAGYSASKLRDERGYTAADLRDAGYGANEMKSIGYTAIELRKAGYSASELRVAGYNVTELSGAGYTIFELKDAGYKGKELRCAGYSASKLREEGNTAKELRVEGYSATELRVAGYDLTELKKAGYSATELRVVGCNLGELMCVGYSLTELRDAGYNHVELRDAGYNLTELKNAGYTAEEFNKAGYSAIQLRYAGYSAKELRGAEYGLTELRNAGYSARELKGAGYNLRELKYTGYSATELRGAGYSATELKDAGYSAKELKDAGYSATELSAAGYSAKELREEGYNHAELRLAGYNHAELRVAGYNHAELRVAGYNLTELRDAGYNLTELRDAGYNLTELRDAGYSLTELRDAGYSLTELRDAGYNHAELRVAGYNLTELRDAGYNLTELRDAGYSLTELRDAGYSAKELRDAGFAPVRPAPVLHRK